ncbi:TPA: hypothetical protein GLX13_18385 [Escherichia coli]|nr:hypothetical protein [Escherichia coli]
MRKSDAEKIDLILDEHERVFRKQRPLYMALGNGALITGISCVVAAFCVHGTYLKILFTFVACCCAVCSFLFCFTSLPELRMVLSRQTLLQLMRLTEDSPDARLELLNRLLSGKRLTGLDEKEIRSLWWKSRSDAEDTAARRHEQDAIRKFVGEDKSE